MFSGYDNFKPLIWAHRGFSAIYPQNSLRAFSEAVDAGAHGIECDLQLTRDHVVVIAHDSSVAGRGGQLLNWADLLWSDVASGMPAGPPVARLESLSELPACTLLNLELKEQGALNPVLLNKTSEIIARNHWEERVLLSSFSKSLLDLCAEQHPQWPRAALWASWLPDVSDFSELVQVDAVHVASTFLREETMQIYQQTGYAVACWDLDDKQTRLWIDRDINGVIVDDPRWARAPGNT